MTRRARSRENISHVGDDGNTESNLFGAEYMPALRWRKDPGLGNSRLIAKEQRNHLRSEQGQRPIKAKVGTPF